MPSAQDAPLTPYSYAQQWRDARAAKDTKNVLVPPGGVAHLSGHYNNSYQEAQHQDRLYLPYRLAWELKRCSGYIANIRYENSGLNAVKPASAQVVVKVVWHDSSEGCVRHVFARTTAHVSSYAPRMISPCSFAHFALGDIVSGVLETPSSKQCSTCLLSWDLPEMDFLTRIHGPQLPNWFDVVLEPKVVADLPQLGGSNFWPCPNNSALLSLRFELPPSDVNKFKSDSREQAEIQAAYEAQKAQRVLSATPTIFEGSTDMPPLPNQVNESASSSGQSNLPLLTSPNTTRDSLILKLSNTVTDQGAFPNDRLLAAQYLQEAGAPIPTLRDDTPI